MVFQNRVPATLRPVGYVENNFDEPTGADQIKAAESRIVLDPTLVDGLEGLEPGQTVMVIFYFHRSQGYALRQHPRGDENRPRAASLLCAARGGRTRSASAW